MKKALRYKIGSYRVDVLLILIKANNKKMQSQNINNII